MAFFDNSFSYGYGDGVAVSEAYDADFGGVENIIAESYEDELSIIKAIHAADMAELGAIKRGVATESYEMAIAMEASISDIFETIKNALKKFFAKIGQFFKSLYQKLFIFSKSNASFVESYKPTLEELKSYIGSVKFTSYDWNVSRLVGDGEKSRMNKSLEANLRISEDQLKVAEDSVNKIKKDNLDNYSYTENVYSEENLSSEAAFGLICSAYGVTKAEGEGNSIRQAVLSFYRNGNEKTTDKVYKYDELIFALDTLKGIDPKPFKKAESTISKNYDKALKFVDKAKNEAEAWSKDTKGKTAIVSATKDLHKELTATKALALKVVGAERTVVTEFAADIKGATIKAIAEGKAKKKDADKKSK